MRRLRQLIDRGFYRFSRTTDTRRAAILGAGFGLLLCVIVLMFLAVLSFIAGLGQ